VVEVPEPAIGLTSRRPPRVGVAGWSYPDWEGIVYPKSSGLDRLAYLVRFFETIEINSPFYRIPSSRTTASWARRCHDSPEFRFTVKLYRGFTHERNAGTTEAHEFRQALAPLKEAGVLGALLLQFPWSFKNDSASRRYLDELLKSFGDYPLVIEVRHASWNEPEIFGELRRRRVGFCNIDQPVIGRSLEPSRLSTGPVGYVRLHGRNYADWFREEAGRDERYDYLYREEELDPWMDRISEIADHAAETYVITNNHFQGQAVVNALQIRSRLEHRRVKAPGAVVERYPTLRPFVTSDVPEQGRLF
jgi:uncharacterized protein YecE (DUF72 family)